MNAEEKLRVARLVTRLARQAEAPQDEDAALELAALLKVRPDAPYLLMQRTLMLELALERAQAELEQLRQARSQAQDPAQPHNPYQASAGYEPSQPVPSAVQASQRPSAAPSGGWQPGVNTGPTLGNLPGYGQGVSTSAAPSAAGGFLRNAAAVGAGVLGGSLLFHGLDSLFHSHGGGQASNGLLDQGGSAGLLSGDMQAPLDAISGNDFLDPANDPLASGGSLLGGDMLGDGGEFDDGGDDWA
ncbi:DUF2076 domain-containing protein [Azohydromonas lata]|uniref:DUF2076 family protein n=1 Tax=Azohydromonas lata TaxID=45677 RepID=A0ABU5ILK9_9BURK|nr:DUF2076 family protein [Azohydromonas lata]MDZ5459785.1 DUF2076 family protein [Azohydromonas lata]